MFFILYFMEHVNKAVNKNVEKGIFESYRLRRKFERL